MKSIHCYTRGATRIGPRCLYAGLSTLAVAAIAFALSAPPAAASEEIESFTTTTSTTQAGGHPDLSTTFALDSPGNPEAARNVIFNAPTASLAILTRSLSAPHRTSPSISARPAPRAA